MSRFSAGKSPTCAYSSEGLNDHPLVVVGAGGSLENVEENLLEEHLHTRGKASALQSAAGGLECQTLSNRIAKCRASNSKRLDSTEVEERRGSLRENHGSHS